ncbi:MAG: PAS domain-containing protein [Verrucomicrobiae bacterium]|nr:PAS domain-containing protein [Verrucomicrobiae bacterium]
MIAAPNLPPTRLTDVMGAPGAEVPGGAVEAPSDALYRSLMETLPHSVFRKDRAGRFTFVNRQFCETLRLAREGILGHTDADLFPAALASKFSADDQRVMQTRRPLVTVEEHTEPGGGRIVVEVTKHPLLGGNGEVCGVQGMFVDITDRVEADRERRRIEVQLRHSQKMEAVGQLAAGIAHEINTPTQFIGDNIRFLKDSFEDLRSALEAYGRLFEAVQTGSPVPKALLDEVGAWVARADIPYLIEEIPTALRQSLDGVTRVATIVRAIKDFSHPGGEDKTPTDLNRAIDSTLTVSRNEWKYVAEIVTDFDPGLPCVPCLPGEFNQVILNLVVNAAHALGDAMKERGGAKGTITVRTRRAGDFAEVRVEDTGTGIPEQARGRVFEPFFTTKEVGRGSGQGLAIAHSVIVEKHGGSIRFETESGRGTTFIILLPLHVADEGTLSLRP